MAHKQVIPTRSGRYGTRMLTAGEPLMVPGPEARAMIALGRAQLATGARRYTPVDSRRPDEMAVLRNEYQAKFGKRPFNGWDAGTLREKIAAAS